MGGRYVIVDTGSWLAAVRFFMGDQSWTICHLLFEAVIGSPARVLIFTEPD
jgi:hypothetical protein